MFGHGVRSQAPRSFGARTTAARNCNARGAAPRQTTGKTPGAALSSAKVPDCLTRPSTRTTIRSASRTVLSRCAMTIRLTFRTASEALTEACEALSRALVASSSSRIRGRRAMARASRRRWRCPPESVLTPSVTISVQAHRHGLDVGLEPSDPCRDRRQRPGAKDAHDRRAGCADRGAEREPRGPVRWRGDVSGRRRNGDERGEVRSVGRTVPGAHRSRQSGEGCGLEPHQRSTGDGQEEHPVFTTRLMRLEWTKRCHSRPVADATPLVRAAIGPPARSGRGSSCPLRPSIPPGFHSPRDRTTRRHLDRRDPASGL